MNTVERHKIMISDHELDSPEAKADLLKLTGRNTYKKVLQQFAQQRVPIENPGGFSEADIEKMSESEYEQAREKIFADLNKLPDPKKPVFAEVVISETQLATPMQHEIFLKRFGFDRYMQAQGLQGLEELTPKAYHQILGREFKPYKTSG